MNKLLTRGGIEIIAVFIGISGGLWSEKQIELKNSFAPLGAVDANDQEEEFIVSDAHAPMDFIRHGINQSL